MADKYISAEALKRDLIDNRGFYPVIVHHAIEDASAADVVEVVRCRDCKRREIDSLCEYFEDNDFCSHGERKQDYLTPNIEVNIETDKESGWWLRERRGEDAES